MEYGIADWVSGTGDAESGDSNSVAIGIGSVDVCGGNYHVTQWLSLRQTLGWSGIADAWKGYST